MASSSEQEIAECTDSRVDDCTIHCVSSDCDGQVINAADKDSLTVICQDSFTEDGCADLDIICPANGDCTIHCDMVSGCDRLNVTHSAVSNEGDVTLICSADLSCRNIHIDAPNANHLAINATVCTLYSALTHRRPGVSLVDAL